MSGNNFFKELKRRNVIKAGITYAAVSWFLVQAASIVFPALEMSNSAMQYLLIGLIVIFPLWLVFAWVYEYTPQGFKKTGEITEEESVSKTTRKRLNSIIIGGMGLAIILLLTDRIFNLTESMLVSRSDMSIAVLPFSDMSYDKNQEYIGDGIAEGLVYPQHSLLLYLFYLLFPQPNQC